MNQTTFKPHPDAIRVAELLMLAMAHEDLVRPIVEAYQQEILERRRFPVNPQLRESDPAARLPDVITDRKDSFLMSPADMDAFVAECDVAMRQHRLSVDVPGQCPLLVAESQRMDAERVLLEEVAKIDPRLAALSRLAQGGLMSQRKQAIELTLKLLAPFVRGADEIMESVVKRPASPGMR